MSSLGGIANLLQLQEEYDTIERHTSTTIVLDSKYGVGFYPNYRGGDHLIRECRAHNLGSSRR